MTHDDFLFKAKAIAARACTDLIDKKLVMLIADALYEAYEAGRASPRLTADKITAEDMKTLDHEGVDMPPKDKKS